MACGNQLKTLATVSGVSSSTFLQLFLRLVHYLLTLCTFQLQPKSKAIWDMTMKNQRELTLQQRTTNGTSSGD